MKYTENGSCLKELYLENSNVNWVEGTFHLWGECVYPDGFSATTNRILKDGVLTEEYIFTNTTDKDIAFIKGDLGVWATFNDSYEGSVICKDKKCHAHIWMGGTSSWSAAGAMLYAYMGKLTDDVSYLKKARACIRTTLSCFFEDGSATCAIVTPFKVNGMRGEFIDPWANDQDWAMYFALVFDEEFGI